MNTISINELKNFNNPIIIDIRDNYNYTIGHIPTAINIKDIFLKEMPEKYLNKKNTYYLYCSIGHKSQNLVNYLNTLGYHCYSIEGGYRAYHNILNN